jgi:8-oxo-dGTP diphosphatase
VDDRALVELRCSAIVFRGDAVLLLGRRRDGTDDWVLPGGHPRPREGTAACAHREVREETGLDVQVGRVAFVLETTDPTGARRLIEIVFLASEQDARAEPKAREPGLWPAFVPVDDTPRLALRPPIAGYLRGLHRTRLRSTAPYLGNLWREPSG